MLIVLIIDFICNLLYNFNVQSRPTVHLLGIGLRVFSGELFTTFADFIEMYRYVSEYKSKLHCPLT